MSTYSSTSPYFDTNITQGYLGMIQFRDIPNNADDVLYEIPSKYENRPDLLAYDLYQDSTLWWVFAVRNRSVIKDPIYDLKPGISIFIPQTSTLKSVLGI